MQLALIWTAAIIAMLHMSYYLSPYGSVAYNAGAGVWQFDVLNVSWSGNSLNSKMFYSDEAFASERLSNNQRLHQCRQ